jgi:hypothetical protein
MIILGAYQGLRAAEIAKIRGEDLDLDDMMLRVLGKGGVDARLPIHPEVAAVAKTMPARGYWFPAPRTPGPRAPGLVSTIISVAMRTAGVRGTAHSLRHWYGTTLVHTGTDLRTTQTLMRHATLATTERYIAVGGERQIAGVLRLPGMTVPEQEGAPTLSPAVDGAEQWRRGADAYDHLTSLRDGVPTCLVCGPLADGFWTMNPRTERPACVMFTDHAATAEERITLGCPVWCDPYFHDRSESGTLHPTDRHGSDLGRWTGLHRAPDGQVFVTLFTDDCVTELTPADVRKLAAELLNAAAAAEAG